MRAAALLLAISLLPLPSQAASSAFATVQFGEVAQITLPRNWTYMDKQVADHLNTSSEAVLRLIGIAVSQGDNKILVAANALDANGKTKATIRLSVRKAPSPTQSDMRELAKQPPRSIEAAFLPSANATAEAMLKVPGIKSYKVRGVKLDRNNALLCTWSSYEGDYGDRWVVSDTWICPLGDRRIKLTTSYDKLLESIYRPIIEYVWLSLTPMPSK